MDAGIGFGPNSGAVATLTVLRVTWAFASNVVERVVIGCVCGPQRTLCPAIDNIVAGQFAAAKVHDVAVGAFGVAGPVGAIAVNDWVCGPHRTAAPVCAFTNLRPVASISLQICAIVMRNGAAAAAAGKGAAPPQSIVLPVVELTKPCCRPVLSTQSSARVSMGAGAACGMGATTGAAAKTGALRTICGDRAVAVVAVGICTNLGAVVIDATVCIGAATLLTGAATIGALAT